MRSGFAPKATRLMLDDCLLITDEIQAPPPRVTPIRCARPTDLADPFSSMRPTSSLKLNRTRNITVLGYSCQDLTFFVRSLVIASRRPSKPVRIAHGVRARTSSPALTGGGSMSSRRYAGGDCRWLRGKRDGLPNCALMRRTMRSRAKRRRRREAERPPLFGGDEMRRAPQFAPRLP